MPGILQEMLLGKEPLIVQMYPKDEHLKNAILDTFGIADDNIVVRTEFENAWGKQPKDSKQGSLKSLVGSKVRLKRGEITRVARKELYRLLNAPKPPESELLEKRRDWYAKLEDWRTGISY